LGPRNFHRYLSGLGVKGRIRAFISREAVRPFKARKEWAAPFRPHPSVRLRFPGNTVGGVYLVVGDFFANINHDHPSAFISIPGCLLLKPTPTTLSRDIKDWVWRLLTSLACSYSGSIPMDKRNPYAGAAPANPFIKKLRAGHLPLHSIFSTIIQPA